MIKIAGTLLYTSKGQVILHRRDDKAPTSPNLLGLFGGHIEEGEGPEQAARRELSEETSLDVSKLTLKKIGEFELEHEGEKVHFTTYSAIVTTSKFKVHEGVGAEVYSPKEALARTDLTRSTRITIIKAQERT